MEDKGGADMAVKNEIALVTQENIRNKIYTIRGQRVMLDSDLAAIYGYTTTTFNQQVKNNKEKFEEDFMFILTADEFENLISKNLTSSLAHEAENADLSDNLGKNLKSQIVTSSWGGRRKLPKVFTEQGIYMLMTVLKGELAVQQSKALIRLFKGMKDYISENRSLIGTDTLAKLTVQNTIDIAEIKNTMATKDDIKAIKNDLQKVMDNFIDPDTYKHFLILDGQKIEAEEAYTKIYKSAKKSVYVIDNYIGLKTLELLRAVKKGVQVTVFSDNLGKDKLTQSTFSAFCKEYPNVKIELKTTNGKYHDRYAVIDHGTDKEKIYHCGTSSKDAGERITTITKIEDTALYGAITSELTNNPPLKLK